jgi:hypothetical protein
VVVLEYVISDEASADLKTENLAAMLKRYNEVGHSQIMVYLFLWKWSVIMVLQIVQGTNLLLVFKIKL